MPDVLPWILKISIVVFDLTWTRSQERFEVIATWFLSIVRLWRRARLLRDPFLFEPEFCVFVVDLVVPRNQICDKTARKKCVITSYLLHPFRRAIFIKKLTVATRSLVVGGNTRPFQ